MVRPKDQRVWQHYRQAKNKSVFCIYCDKKYKFPHAQKMKRHLIKCQIFPYKHKKELINDASNMRKSCPDKYKENLSTNADSAVSSSQIITRKQKEDLDELLAMAIYVSGTPLSIVEHPLWKQFFNELNSMYKLPSKEAISTTHLDNAFKKINNDLNNEMRSLDFLHLQLGGWTDVNNSGILNFTVSKPEPVFVKSIDTDNRHTSKFLKKEILNVMSQYNESKFVVLIGDNTQNIQRAFSLVREIHRHITPLNCIAHTLNLLSNDIMQSESLKAFVDLAVDIINTVKNNEVLTVKLLAQDTNVGETLKLPSQTPWGSYHACLSSLDTTKTALQSLAIDSAVSGILTSETKTALLDDDFWDMISQSIRILRPISDVIRKLASNDCNMSNVFLTLKNTKSQMKFILSYTKILSIEDKESIMTSIDHRINSCIKPIHLSAHLLDPRSLGNELDENQELEALEYINDMAHRLSYPDIMQSLASYKAKEGNVWGKSFIWNNISNIDLIAWWKGLGGLTKLSDIACRILTAPCTSVAVQHSFNIQDNMHTKKRITSQSAAKIAYLSYNWNLTSVKNHNDANKIKIEQNEDDSDNEFGVSSSPTMNNSSIAFGTPSNNSILISSLKPEASTSHNGFEFMDCSSTLPEYGSDSD